MDTEMKESKTVRITMKDYIHESFDVFALFEDKINKEVTSAANNNLFKLTEEWTRLSKDKNEGFHHIVYKILYASKRTRLHIDLAISFLCTRVTCSIDEDWGKLRRLLHYLQGTIDLERIIGVGKGGLGNIFTWVDASYTTHFDMKGHTGAVTSLGIEVVHMKCSKQKLNTKNLTESELVGASD